jgi:hypothetical protein
MNGFGYAGDTGYYVYSHKQIPLIPSTNLQGNAEKDVV